MKIGTPINELASRILTEAKSKRDFIADTRSLTMTEDGRISVGIEKAGEHRVFLPTRLCQDQIAGRVGIPAKYAERMRSEAPALLARNVNHWFAANPEKRMLRCLDNGNKVARAFLSDRFRPLDNYDLANSILPKLADAGCEVKSCELTERRLYIQAVTPRIAGEVKKGDEVQAGIVISNSEVGCGSVKIEPLIYRLVCLNGMILPNSLRKYHVGRVEDGNEDGNELFSTETRKLSDKAFWAQVCDVVDGSLDQIKFNASVQRLRDATNKQLGNPVDVVEMTTRTLELTEGEGKSVLEHLVKGSDLSLYGLVQAVTRSAQDCESYDRAIEMERMGSTVLEMKPQDFILN